MHQSVSPETLATYLHSISRKLLEEHPTLNDQPGLVDKIVDDTTQILRYKEAKSKAMLTKQKLLDPEFLKQLTQTMITEAVLHGFQEQLEFIEALKQAIHANKLSYQTELHSLIQEQEALLNDISDIMNELNDLINVDPEIAGRLQEKLRKKLQKRLHKKLLKKLEKLLSFTLNPKNKEALRDSLRKLMNAIKASIEHLKKNKSTDKTLFPIHEDIYINLFGLLNSYIAGSIAVPLTQYLGNGLGFNDWNPHHGYANIDKINEINFMFGDSLGIEANTLRNFFAIEDDMVNALTDLLIAEGLEAAPAPKMPSPFDISSGPKKS